MSQTRPKKQVTPLNADSFNLVPDWAATADTSGVIVSVADQAEGDTIAAALSAAGYPVTDARPLYCWDLSRNALMVKNTAGWKSTARPFGHMGRTAGAQSIASGSPTKVVMDAAQQLEGGMTFSNADDSLQVPITGFYRVTIKCFFQIAAASTVNRAGVWLNTSFGTGMYSGADIGINKADATDVFSHSSCRMSFTAGDKVGIWHATSGSAYGTNGYDGSFLELEYWPVFG